ncbi:hypothetical protein EV191_104232 [Tamaricihabitans halophyticus]|uniref:Prenyltransferase/squalene oxidase-like repeat protein n=1 Tax=Tamaricihabitans halophyticus TaxID=1262583 RepID=A0A4R2QUJ5_9PSEU|nr:hypothetical protein [Tamaricihabitans halophyticus]TCP53663.1 hypothetical protein EV191_104232 [Tamaricihabitans halophyticus]
MSIDLKAARKFTESTARLLERHQLAVLLDDAPIQPVLTALKAYQNSDGGFGHALEPDVRCPGSQPAAALSALDVLIDVAAGDDPMITELADWTATIAHPDGGLPTVLPSAAAHPHAPWMAPDTAAGFFTYALAARLWRLGVRHPWLDKATAWCWNQIDAIENPAGYTVKCALEFLDAVPDPVRAAAAIERFRPAIRADGTVPVEGGIENEHIKPLDLSPRPAAPSRELFGDKMIEADLERLEGEQLGDGGWDFHFLHFSPGQTVEWRGLVTLAAIRTLRTHGRV